MSPAMAVVTTENEESQYHNGVKRLHENGISKVPSKYILPVLERPNVTKHQAANVTKHNLKLPIIDVHELQGPNRPQVLESLANACEQYGFFQLVNHGIPSDVVSNMIDVGTKFFELPFEERAKYMSSDMRAPVRYGTSFNQNKDTVLYWRDFLKLMCHPLPDVLPQWPSSPIDMSNNKGEGSGMAQATSPRLPVLITTRQDCTPQTQSSSSIVELHKCIRSLITMLGFCLPLKFANASPFVTVYDTIMITLFIVDLYAYFGSLAVIILQAARSDTDLGEFLNKISFLLGILAVILELLILVPPLGWATLFFWSFYFVSIVIKSYPLMKTLCDCAIAAFGKLKEKLRTMKGYLMDSRAVTELGGAYEKLKELFRSLCHLTGHEPRDRFTEAPV